MMRHLFFSLALLAACKDDGGTDAVDSLPDINTDADADGFDEENDCDDQDPTVNPAAQELCDSLDNNCDGLVDNEASDASTWYTDADQDGYGLEALLSCETPPGTSAQGGDCDDSRADIHPGASEDCTDPTDYNCDGSVGYADADSDGWAACEDCDDGDASRSPGASEVCNGLDDDCDSAVDDADDSLDRSSGSTWYQDSDSDGYGDSDYSTQACEQPAGYSDSSTDCDDLDSAVNPSGAELCDSVDNNCDGNTDEDSAADASTWYQDADADGYGDADYSTQACEQPAGYSDSSTDCDDLDGAVSPSGTELCDGLDNNCDGNTDEDSAADASTWYQDADADGYGDGSASTSACAQPSGYVANDQDCDDGKGATNPAATELCDLTDNDCDGTVDDPAELLGSAAACGAKNCNEILSTRSSAPDGEYYVDHAGSSLQVYCDMTTSGGGWTVIHPDDIGSLGSLDTMRDEMDRVMAYLRTTTGTRYYTELEQLPAFTAYDVAAEDQSSTTFRFTFIPRTVANVAGMTQGMRSNGSDLTFTNCDANPNSYIEFWQTGSSYTWNQDYTMSKYWRDSKLAASVTVPDDYFTFTAIHFGGCGTHSTSPYWSGYDNMKDAAFAVR